MKTLNDATRTALTEIPDDLSFVDRAVYDAILNSVIKRVDEENPAPTKYSSREQWLQHYVDALRPYFAEVANVDLPEVIHVSVGWPSQRALSNKSRRVGECWTPEGEAPHIFISPLLDDEVEILGVLVHELIHAARVAPADKPHGIEFKRVAVALGLEGKMTATTVGESLHAYLTDLLSQTGLGEMPHSKITAAGRPTKKQTTRLLKVECTMCGYIARVTRKWIEEVGPPICPCNGEYMEPAV